MMASADTQTRRLTMPPRLLPILLLMFGVQASVSLQSLRVASLPQLKNTGRSLLLIPLLATGDDAARELELHPWLP